MKMEVRVETKISREDIFNLSWLKIYQDTVQIEGASQATRIVLDHPGAACILAVNQENEVLLVKQFRYPVGKPLLEVPAGKNDEWGANDYETALRELAEETPFTAESVEKIYSFYTAPGFTNELITLYKAVNIKQNSTLKLDPDEFVEVLFYTKDEVKTMMKNGDIQDAKTILALQYWLSEDE